MRISSLWMRWCVVGPIVLTQALSTPAQEVTERPRGDPASKGQSTERRETLLVFNPFAAEEMVTHDVSSRSEGIHQQSIAHEVRLNDLDEFLYQIELDDPLTAVVAVFDASHHEDLEPIFDVFSKTAAKGTPVVWALIEEPERLVEWADTGFDPFFLATETTTPVVLIRGLLPIANGGIGHFSVALGDTGAWVESADLQEDLPQRRGKQQNAACDAGPWWPTCCYSQYYYCTLLQNIPEIGPLLCPACLEPCFLDCMECPSNPCHSCDPCGLSWLLCSFVPGGRC